jgi:iron complex outermembrane receptor protein|tara:strand:- start:906 stop:1433 length:528 start_codon:yes stop_codon:yes gene_type:complete
LINNQLQNIGTIETSGFDVALAYASPDTDLGNFLVTVNATNLDKYTETTNNTDGSTTVSEFAGIHTNETFERAFPEWRMVTSVDWMKERWSGTLSFRWIDEMESSAGTRIDSAMFTDLQLRYEPSFINDSLTLTAGFNNVFDEDPPVCDCNLIGLSTVAHDIPGRVGYLRASYEF